MIAHRLKSERIPQEKATTEIMMQSGLLSIFEVINGHCERLGSTEYFCRGLMLAEQNQDTLLEGLARAMPVFFDDAAGLQRLCEGGALVIVSMCCDRASANFRACAWMWKQMDSPLLRRCILPHFEPCALHGVSLVKCRSQGAKTLIAAMASLGCLMKQERFARGLRQEILHQVRSRLRVVSTPRPAECSARAESLARALYAADTDDWLYRTSSSGERYKSQLLLDLEALCAAVDFGSTADELTHHCCVQEGDAEHAAGATPGDACCRSREESVEKVAAPLIQWFCHKSWD